MKSLFLSLIFVSSFFAQADEITCNVGVFKLRVDYSGSTYTGQLEDLDFGATLNVSVKDKFSLDYKKVLVTSDDHNRYVVQAFVFAEGAWREAVRIDYAPEDLPTADIMIQLPFEGNYLDTSFDGYGSENHRFYLFDIELKDEGYCEFK